MSNISRWQYWWSYIRDIHIESRSSDHNEDLHVVLSRGRYQLLTDSAIYSHEDLYYNFRDLLRDKLHIRDMDISDVLVLGLGLGSIPIILDDIRPGHWHITAVEIDEEICDLAHTYGYPRITSDIQTITGDAAIYVETTQEKYDIICVDLFCGDYTPEVFRSEAFLQRLQHLLRPNGLIIFNTLAFTAEDKRDSKKFFDKTFRRVYPKAKSICIHKNNMLISHGDWLTK